MSAGAPRPATVVLVHGSWHGPWCWEPLRAELADLTTLAVSLPSTSSDVGAFGTRQDDALAIREAVSLLDGPVVVVAHSAAGVSVGEALTASPAVVGIVFLAALVLEDGQRPSEVAGGTLPDWLVVHDAASGSFCDVLAPDEVLYPDVPPDVRRWAVPRLRHQFLDDSPATAAAWRTIPSTFVVCDDDRTLPAAVQVVLAQEHDAVGRLDSGHAPFLSRPADLATLLRAEVASFVG